MTKKQSLTGELTKKVNSTFSLDKFKTGKNLGQSNSNYKKQEWIKFSPAVSDILQLPGVAKGHINLIRGRSNTCKTTLIIEQAIQAQKDGILPVIIITEMKHSWEHWETMGFDLGRKQDKDGNEYFDGFFLYADRETLHSIEDVAAFHSDLLDEQKKGNLPYDLLFIWDSIGSIPCQMSIDKKSNSPMWNAGSLSTQFANFINQRIVMSRKESQPYTNTALYVNKIWIEPALTPMSQPKMKNKNGDSMFYDASIVITFGNITSDGTQKINATRKGKTIEFALKTRVACDKNHVTGVTAKGTLVGTPHGFIIDTPSSIDIYKKEHKEDWANLLGGDFELEEVESEDIFEVDLSPE